MLGRLLSSRYRIVRILGSGGFGHTYVTEDTQRPGNPWCVLKHLSFASHDPAILEQARRMFLVEAETLEKLGRHDQIPQLLAYFEEDQEFYLVQEYIEGHSLSDELTSGTKLSEAKVIDLLEDILRVLEFVHAQEVIHRDIKPENLIRRDRDHKLVLIDFGAVKNIGQSISNPALTTNLSLPVYTSGYAASEQCLGKPRFSSDIYAIGMIGIQALTGVRPSQLPQDPNTCELIWRDQVAVRNDLAAVLEKMTKFHFSQRYQSATEALAALEQVKAAAQTQMPLSQFDAVRHFQKPALAGPQLPQWRSRNFALPLAISVGIGATVGLAIWMNSRPPIPAIVPIESLNPIQSQISFGEKILTPGQTTAIKQAGVDHIAAGDLKQAALLLEKARRSQPADPETLIYLNNARIGEKKSHTVAVVVPLSTQPYSSAEVLRGVAQVQNQVNQQGGIKGIPLKVAIATDNSQPKMAQQVADAFVKDSTVLGVVGHGTSDTTLAAAEIYQTGELVTISPVSSAKQLSGFSRYVFRTMPSDQLPAKRLSEYMLTQLKKRKAAVFFNSGSTYSKSLKDEFKAALFYSGKGQVVEEVDLNQPDFNPVEGIDQALKKGAQVLMLASNSEFFDRTLLVIDANQNRLPLLAGDVLFSPKTLQIGDKAVSGMVLAVPSYQVEADGSLFQQQATALWGEAVSWRTILAYDAARAFVGAIQRSPTRKGIRSALADPSFSVSGAVQPVSFLSTGDRPIDISFVKVMPERSRKRFVFKSLASSSSKR